MEINQLIEKCKKLHAFQNERSLFHTLNSLDKTTLSGLELRFDEQGIFRPVNFLRFLVARLLNQGVEFSREKLEALKSAIQERNILEFYPGASELLLQNVKAYKTSDKGMFPQWKEPFPVLYQFFYSNEEKEEVIQTLKNFGNEIIQTYSLENALVHPVGFDGPQNYGADIAWGAVIPSNAKSVQHAFQLFFGFNGEGVFGGLYRGHKVENIPFQEINKQYDSWEDYLKSLEELIPTWIELNSRIDFSFQKEDAVFEKRIKSFQSSDVNTFFNVLDWLISDLELADLGNLVFSKIGRAHV